MGDHLRPELDATVEQHGGGGDGGDWRPGLRLTERYVLRRFLGKGGMGQVWVAFDAVLDKEVALKRVRGDIIAAGAALEQLRREVLLAQTVTHANVCRIHDLEPIGGDWVIKMEVVGGRCLADLVKETGALPLDAALAIARQLADGLAAVHAVGIVHRDLKPHNVLVDGERAVLMDFGIARSTAPTGDTEEARIIGTPEYMAPEQARGEAVDARADLYALGCVVYRMVAGDVPFPAATRIAAMARHLTDEPPDLRKKRPDAPAWLAQLVRELMAKAPAARPRDAATVRTRLAGPPPRWPAVARGGAVALLASVALAVGLVGWRAHVRDSWRPIVRDLPAQLDAESVRYAPSPEGSRIAYDARRDDEWRVFIADRDGGNAHAVTDGGYFFVGWSLDGRTLLVRSLHNRILRVDPETRAATTLAEFALGAADAGRFGLLTVERSPACALCTRLMRRRADGTVDELVPPDDRSFVMPTIAVDVAGARIGYNVQPLDDGPWRVFVMPLDPTRVLPATQLPLGDGPVGIATFTGPSTAIVGVAVNDANEDELWEITLDNKRRRQLTFGGRTTNVVLRGDRIYLQTLTSTAPLFAWDYATSTRRRLTFGDRIDAIVPLPDGRHLMVTSQHGGERQRLMLPTDGGPGRVVFHARAESIAVDDRVRDGKVYFQPNARGTGGPLYAVGVDGGVIAQIMPSLRGELELVRDGVVHSSSFSDKGTVQLWRTPLDDSRPADGEDVAPWDDYVPAPAGGWRLGYKIVPPTWALFAPGVSLQDRPTRVLHGPLADWSYDGASVLWFDGKHVNRYELASGTVTPIVATTTLRTCAESPDGKTLYFVEDQPTVQRQVITNFGDRPSL